MSVRLIWPVPAIAVTAKRNAVVYVWENLGLVLEVVEGDEPVAA